MTARDWVYMPTGDRPRPKGFRKGRNQACYRNAQRAASERGWTYCEGLALTEFSWIHHAWCVDQAGAVVEATYGDLASEYYGVAFGLDEVRDNMIRTGFFGALLGDHEIMRVYAEWGWPGADEAARELEPDHARAVAHAGDERKRLQGLEAARAQLKAKKEAKDGS